MRALPAHRQSAAMADATVASEIRQPLDRLLHLAPEIALDLVAIVEHLADADLLLGRQVVALSAKIDVGRLQDLERGGAPDPVDIRQRDFHPLVPGKLDSRYARHPCGLLSLTLLVAWIGTDDTHHTKAAYHLAILADFFYRGSNLHNRSSTHPVRTPA